MARNAKTLQSIRKENDEVELGGCEWIFKMSIKVGSFLSAGKWLTGQGRENYIAQKLLKEKDES